MNQTDLEKPVFYKRPIVQYSLAGLALAIALLTILVLHYLQGEPGNSSRDGVERITVNSGASTWNVANSLQEHGLIRSAKRFVYHVKYRKLDGELKLGTYDIPRSASMEEMADILTRGQEVLVTVTIREGITSMAIASQFMEAGICDSSSFMESVHDTAFARSLQLPYASLEGFLYPETYRFRLNETPQRIITTMVETFRENVGEEWIEAANNHELGFLGVVTLASIVAGEYQVESEASIIAGLYSNRLERGWKLQADPTIQYIIPGHQERLLYSDLEIDSPYNTYRNHGLPPGPINNPGLIALQAALEPADVPWMYMVARGHDGSHVFTRTYKEHTQATERYRRYQRRMERLNGGSN